MLISEFCVDNEENVSNDEDDSNGLNDDFVLSRESEIDLDTVRDLTILSCIPGDLKLPAMKKQKHDIKPNDPFIFVTDAKGNEHVVPKSSICWLLNSRKCILSNDKLERVKDLEYQKTFILCTLYEVDKKGILIPSDIAIHSYFPIERYRLTIPLPVFSGSSMYLDKESYKSTRKEI